MALALILIAILAKPLPVSRVSVALTGLLLGFAAVKGPHLPSAYRDLATVILNVVVAFVIVEVCWFSVKWRAGAPS